MEIKYTVSDESEIIPMNQMQPLDIGVIVNSSHNCYNNVLVMRTASRDKIEIMNLSNPRPDGCWTCGLAGDFMVKLFSKGTKITLEITV